MNVTGTSGHMDLAGRKPIGEHVGAKAEHVVQPHR